MKIQWFEDPWPVTEVLAGPMNISITSITFQRKYPAPTFMTFHIISSYLETTICVLVCSIKLLMTFPFLPIMRPHRLLGHNTFSGYSLERNNSIFTIGSVIIQCYTNGTRVQSFLLTRVSVETGALLVCSCLFTHEYFSHRNSTEHAEWVNPQCMSFECFKGKLFENSTFKICRNLSGV